MCNLNNELIEKYSERGKNYDYIMKEFTKIKEKLEGFKTSNGRDISVFLQGSYKNNTNIDKNSDIDIVAYCPIFMSNIWSLKDNNTLNFYKEFDSKELARYNNAFTTANYNLKKFKDELFKYLNAELNNESVWYKSKTIKCKINNSNFTFDIVPAFEYRFYIQPFIDADTKYIQGNTILDTTKNIRIINFPKQTYLNSVEKMRKLKIIIKQQFEYLKILCIKKYQETQYHHSNLKVFYTM